MIESQSYGLTWTEVSVYTGKHVGCVLANKLDFEVTEG